MRNEAKENAILTDSYGRRINYLRLSVTDRCNLRCLYCMPPEGVKSISHDEILSFEEIAFICGILSGMGISAVKITGGEPLTRRGVSDLIRQLKSIEGISRVTMTSNGVLLDEHLGSLKEAGLDAVNISLDALTEEKFRFLSRSEGFEKILPAADRALSLGIPLKINCVPLKSINEDEIVKIAFLAKDKNIAVRFIELMPVGEASSFKPLSFEKTFSLIEKEYGCLSPSDIVIGNGPALYYTLPSFTGQIGFISAVSRCFCAGCNRLRLTAAGVLQSCLSDSSGLDLRSLVRGGANEGQIAQAVRGLAAKKQMSHNFGSAIGRRKLSKKQMFRIGG